MYRTGRTNFYWPQWLSRYSVSYVGNYRDTCLGLKACRRKVGNWSAAVRSPSFYGAKSYNFMFKKPWLLILSWGRPVRSTTSQWISGITVLILSSLSLLGYPSEMVTCIKVFVRKFRIQFWYTRACYIPYLFHPAWFNPQTILSYDTDNEVSFETILLQFPISSFFSNYVPFSTCSCMTSTSMFLIEDSSLNWRLHSQISRSSDRASWLILIMKPNSCTNFSNLFWHKTLHVSDSSSVHRQEISTVHTAMVYEVC